MARLKPDANNVTSVHPTTITVPALPLVPSRNAVTALYAPVLKLATMAPLPTTGTTAVAKQIAAKRRIAVMVS
jgi:hypothetical protein